jgi:hypothetical protein
MHRMKYRAPKAGALQAALRPDLKCTIDSRALPNFTPSPSRHFWPHCAKNVPNTLTESSLCQNPAAFHWPVG